jgi:helicase
MTLNKPQDFAPNSQDQILLFQSGILQSGIPLLLNLPTGGGKTKMSEIGIDATLTNQSLVIYLNPTKKLGYDQWHKWKTLFQEKVGIYNSDFPIPPVPLNEASLIIMTPEKLDLALRSFRRNSWLTSVRLLVVDEIHLLKEGLRGARLEGAIVRFQLINPLAKVIGLSATVDNAQELSQWLGAVLYQSSARSVDHEWEIAHFHNESEHQRRLVAIAHRIQQKQECALIFCKSRRRTQEVAELLTRSGITADYHHAGRTVEERRAVEDGFQSGAPTALSTTTTMAVGINPPAHCRWVVVYDMERWNGSCNIPLDIQEVHQMAGRCGRPEQGKGTVVLMAYSTFDAESYIHQQFEPVLSQLHILNYSVEQCLAALHSGLCSTSEQLQRLLSCTLAAHQGRLPPIEHILEHLQEHGLIDALPIESALKSKSKIKEPNLSITPIARVATRHLLQAQTVEQFHTLIQHPHLTFFDLLMGVVATADYSPILRLDQQLIPILGKYLNRQPSSLLHRVNEAGVAERLGIPIREVINVIYTACLLRLWTQKGHLEDTCHLLGYRYHHDLKLGLEQTINLMLALENLVNNTALVRQNQPAQTISLQEKVKVLIQMLKTGLSETSITLNLVSGIGPKKAKLLKSIGVNDLEELAYSDPEALASATQHLKRSKISIKKAQKYIQQANQLLQQTSAYRYRETWSPDPAQADVALSEQQQRRHYQLVRARELKVMPLPNSAEGLEFHVTGGSEPRLVSLSGLSWHCPKCSTHPEYQSDCKHIIACLIHRQDPSVLAELQALFPSSSPHSFSLYSLWARGRS